VDGGSSKETSCRRSCREGNTPQPLEVASLLKLAATNVLFPPYLWLKQGKSAALLIPAAASLSLFAWLLSLHPTATGRVYAAYGGVYISVAILWLWLVDGVQPSRWDLVGVIVCLAGMAIIMLAPGT